MSTLDTNSGGVEAALEAAAISSERLGAERTCHLSEGERELYLWILERFANATPPDGVAVRRYASSRDLDVDQVLATLASEDLVHAEAEGAISVAYPFSARPRGHRVIIDNTRTVEAMCAIDALGIAAMLNLPIEISSHDPVSGAEIWVRLDPGDGAWWDPETAVVLAGSSGGEGPSFRGCCSVLNFFESGANALQYLVAHRDVAGHAISIPEAIAAGRAIFGTVLKED